MKEELQELARQSRRSLSDFLRLIFEDVIANHKKNESNII